MSLEGPGASIASNNLLVKSDWIPASSEMHEAPWYLGGIRGWYLNATCGKALLPKGAKEHARTFE
jgi:hypothetical protein